MKSLVIINPKSGDYSINRFVTEFTIKKPEWLTIDILLLENEFIEKLIKSTLTDYDSIIIAGGDGTISRIVSIMSYCQNPPPFVPIPIGTGNDFSRFSGWFNIWNKGKFELFFNYLKNAAPSSIDLWDFKEKRFICYLSMGWDAEVVGLYTLIKKKLKKFHLKRKLNTLIYIYCALLKLNIFSSSDKKKSLILSGDNKGKDKTLNFNRKQTIIFSNIKSYAGGSELNNLSNENDGKIDIYYFKNPLEYIFFIVSGRLNFLKKNKPIEQLNHIDISCKSHYNFQIDGEWEGEYREKSFSIKHAGKIFYLKPCL